MTATPGDSRIPNLWHAWRVHIAVAMLLAGLLALIADHAGGAPQVRVLELSFDGAIGPASREYIVNGLDEAQVRGVDAVVLRLDTPGGLASSMRDIIKAMLDSSVPILTFVHPSGSRAASAGTFMLYASHVAAMAPGTNLGAATPVSIGGGSPGGDSPFEDPPTDERAGDAEATNPNEAERRDGAGAASNDRSTGGAGSAGENDSAVGDDNRDRERATSGGPSAMEAKVTNDAVAYLRSLAILRDRNADWAEAAVREGASLPAAEALERGVIDLIAVDVDDLLDQADGRSVDVAGERVSLDLTDATIEVYEQSWRIRLLSVITNPNVALLLMAVGFYGLVFEFMSPGALLPGTVGAISLILGLYSLTLLPLNFAGLGLLLLGLILMLAEAFVPSFGVLGIGGLAAFALGATILQGDASPGFELAWPVIAAIAFATLGFAVLVLGTFARARRRQVKTGREGLVDRIATVDEWDGHRGYVFTDGERWPATADREFEAGVQVRVVRVNGITLVVQASDASDVPGPEASSTTRKTDSTWTT